MLATLVVVGQAHLVPLALHGLAGGKSKAVAWHSHRVLPLWWCPNFWLFQDSQCWLPWWKWDTRSVFHWHCMGQHCCSLVMKLTGLIGGLGSLPLLYHCYTETYFKTAINNGSFFKHGVAWQSTLNGLWGYWAITLQCLLSVQLMSSIAQKQSFTAT